MTGKSTEREPPRPEHVVAYPLVPGQHENGFHHGVCMNRIDHDTEEAVRRFLALIANRYDMAEVIVYGSRARGTHRPDSDADVAVLLRGNHQRLLTVKRDMADAAFDVLLETGILISPLPIWLHEWQHPESYSNPALLQNIDRDGIRLRPTENQSPTP